MRPEGRVLDTAEGSKDNTVAAVRRKAAAADEALPPSYYGGN